MRLVFLGAPGAGKGTQAVKAAQEFGLIHLSTGDLLREAIASKTEIGQRVAEIVKSGALVDDETIITLISERVDRLASFILDGFPRTLPQAEALRALLLEKQKPLDGVIQFNVDEDAILERIKSRAEKEGRNDDSPSTFQKRLETYRAETLPLLAFYRAEGLVYPIDGMASIDAVAQAIRGILERIKDNAK